MKKNAKTEKHEVRTREEWLAARLKLPNHSPIRAHPACYRYLGLYLLHCGPVGRSPHRPLLGSRASPWAIFATETVVFCTPMRVFRLAQSCEAIISAGQVNDIHSIRDRAAKFR
jgi:hypothetical protein